MKDVSVKVLFPTIITYLQDNPRLCSNRCVHSGSGWCDLFDKELAGEFDKEEIARFGYSLRDGNVRCRGCLLLAGKNK
jgi:hypothetical protein